MKLLIVIEGPLHTRPCFGGGKQCYCYSQQPAISWEAQVWIGIQDYKVRDMFVRNSRGLTAWLMQRGTRTSRLRGVSSECEPSTTEFIDLWALPIENFSTIVWRKDICGAEYPLDDLCLKDVMGCRLDSTWDATVSVVLMDLRDYKPEMPRRRNPRTETDRVMNLEEALRFGVDSTGTAAGANDVIVKGTVALSKDSQSPALPTTDDGTKVVGLYRIAAPTEERMTPEDFDEIYAPRIVKTLARREYHMEPVVAHCPDQNKRILVPEKFPVEGVPTSTISNPGLRATLGLHTITDGGWVGKPSSDGVLIDGKEPDRHGKGKGPTRSSAEPTERQVSWSPLVVVPPPPSTMTLGRHWARGMARDRRRGPGPGVDE